MVGLFWSVKSQTKNLTLPETGRSLWDGVQSFSYLDIQMKHYFWVLSPPAVTRTIGLDLLGFLAWTLQSLKLVSLHNYISQSQQILCIFLHAPCLYCWFCFFVEHWGAGCASGSSGAEHYIRKKAHSLSESLQSLPRFFFLSFISKEVTDTRLKPGV